MSADAPRPGVTVVVPTLERGAVLVDCLNDLLAQHHRPLEIIVVDQSAQPHADVIALAERHADVVRHHHVDFRSLPRARNVGWQLARHDIVLYVDDDIRCGPALVTEHVRALQLPNVGIVAGGIEDQHQLRDAASPGAFHAWTATAPPGFAATGECDVDRAGGGNLSAWRRLLRDVGGFDEALGVGSALFEEVDLCLRVKRRGRRVYFNGKARLTHLAVPFGGVRTPTAEAYLHAMAHNRSVVIRRHVSWYETPTALGRSLLFGLSIARARRAPRALIACVSGMIAGLRRGSSPPQCTPALGVGTGSFVTSSSHTLEQRAAPISVVIPCYRNRDTIRRAVLSALDQTLAPAEVIVVDDGSGDGTLDTLHALQREVGADRLTIIALAQNAGQAHARNVGWEAATQEYVALLDADDAWHPRKLELQYGWMRARPSVTITATRDVEDPGEGVAPPVAATVDAVRATPVTTWRQLTSNHLETRTVIMRRDVPYRFESTRRNGEDLLLFSTMVLAGEPAWVLEEVLAFRFKASWGASGVSGAIWKQERGELQVFGKLRRAGYIGVPAYLYATGLSLLKFARRCLVVAVRGARDRGARRAVADPAPRTS